MNFWLLLLLPSGILFSQQDVQSSVSSEQLQKDEVLTYVNSLLDRYNRFDSKITLIRSDSEVVFTDQFSRLTAPIDEVEFRRAGENMGIYCLDGSDCLSQTDVPTAEEEPPRNAYTFGIKESGLARPETNTVIERLNQLLIQTHEANLRAAKGGMKSALVPLSQINNTLMAYYPKEELFGIQDRQLSWEMGQDVGLADMASLTFYIDYQNKSLVLQCIQAGCIQGTAQDQFRLKLVTSEGEIAPEMDDLLASFNTLRKEVLNR